nr:MAG TPA: major capsid protein [Caudoviricetes sp.]
MKIIDQIESIDNKLEELAESAKVATDVEALNQISDEIKELKSQRNQLIQTEDNMDKTVNKPYLETEKAMEDFAVLHLNSASDAEFRKAWGEKLAQNGITVTDKDNYLPRKLELQLETVLTRSNPVYPLFKISNLGALLVTRELTSSDEAQVHIPGTDKVKQAASLKVSAIKPKMIYKVQSINEIDKRTIDNYGELYNTIVAELAQRVIDKIVDLALVEGSATDGETGSSTAENGFISILNETDTNKVAHVAGKKDIVAAVEEAVDSIDAPGRKYLIVTKQQKRDIIAAVRAKWTNTTFFATNQAIQDTFGLDGIVIYQGTKAIKPTVMVEGAYHIDHQPLARIEQFQLLRNENDILVETPATGRPVAFGGISVIDTER